VEYTAHLHQDLVVNKFEGWGTLSPLLLQFEWNYLQRSQRIT